MNKEEFADFQLNCLHEDALQAVKHRCGEHPWIAHESPTKGSKGGYCGTVIADSGTGEGSILLS